MQPSENVPDQGRPVSSPSLVVTRVVPLILAFQVLLTLVIYPFLPNTVPSHWNAAGQIDSYEAKWVYASFLPIFSLVLYVFLRVMFARIGSQSRGQNLRMGQNILTFVIVGQQGLFLIIQAVLLLVALHTGGGSVRSL